MTTKVQLSDQIKALEQAEHDLLAFWSKDERAKLSAAARTLEWLQRNEANVKKIAELLSGFPGGRVYVNEVRERENG